MTGGLNWPFPLFPAHPSRRRPKTSPCPKKALLCRVLNCRTKSTPNPNPGQTRVRMPSPAKSPTDRAGTGGESPPVAPRSSRSCRRSSGSRQTASRPTASCAVLPIICQPWSAAACEGQMIQENTPSDVLALPVRRKAHDLPFQYRLAPGFQDPHRAMPAGQCGGRRLFAHRGSLVPKACQTALPADWKAN